MDRIEWEYLKGYSRDVFILFLLDLPLTQKQVKIVVTRCSLVSGFAPQFLGDNLGQFCGLSLLLHFYLYYHKDLSRPS